MAGHLLLYWSCVTSSRISVPLHNSCACKCTKMSSVLGQPRRIAKVRSPVERSWLLSIEQHNYVGWLKQSDTWPWAPIIWQLPLQVHIPTIYGVPISQDQNWKIWWRWPARDHRGKDEQRCWVTSWQVTLWQSQVGHNLLERNELNPLLNRELPTTK